MTYSKMCQQAMRSYCDKTHIDDIDKTYQAYFRTQQLESKAKMKNALVTLFAVPTPEALKNLILERGGADTLRVIRLFVNGEAHDLNFVKTFLSLSNEEIFHAFDIACIPYGWWYNTCCLQLPTDFIPLFRPFFHPPVPQPEPYQGIVTKTYPPDDYPPTETVKFCDTLLDKRVKVSISTATEFATACKQIPTSHATDTFGFHTLKAMAGFLLGMTDGYYTQKGITVRNLIESFFSAATSRGNQYISINSLLPYLRISRSSNISPAFSSDALHFLLTQLSSLHEGLWYDATQMYAHFDANSLPLTDEATTTNLYFIMKSKFILPENEGKPFLEDMAYRSLYLAILTVFGHFGILDLSESEQIPMPLTDGKGKCYPYSPCDGLKYVRMTPYGRYLLSLTFVKPEEDSTARGETELDDELLVISYTGKSIEIKRLLSSMATMIGSCLYRVTPKSFLESCEGTDDIKRQVGIFMQTLGITKLPPNWQSFFNSLIQKNAKAFSSDSKLYDFPKETMMMLSRDQRIRRIKGLYLILPEHIACEESGRKEFENILLEYGYRMEDTPK